MEDINHLFYFCEVAVELWKVVRYSNHGLQYGSRYDSMVRFSSDIQIERSMMESVVMTLVTHLELS